MTTVLGVTAFVMYVAAGGLLGLRLTARETPPALARAGFTLATAIAVGLHGVVLYRGIVTAAGLNLGFFNAASLIAWVIALLLLLTTLAKPVDNLAALVLPFAAATLVLAIAYPGEEHVLAPGIGTGIRIHVVVSIVAYSVLAIGACQALLLYLQEHLLKRKHPGWGVRVLPPLQVQESLLVQMLGVGFFLLSLSLLSGVMFVQDLFAQHLVHKTVLSVVSWIVFAVLLWGRWRYGWRGRTLTRICLGGFAFLMLAYFGSKLVLELVLGSGWTVP